MDLLLNLLMLCSIAAGCIGLVLAFWAWARGEEDADAEYRWRLFAKQQSQYLADQIKRIEEERGL